MKTRNKCKIYIFHNLAFTLFREKALCSTGRSARGNRDIIDCYNVCKNMKAKFFSIQRKCSLQGCYCVCFTETGPHGGCGAAKDDDYDSYKLLN